MKIPLCNVTLPIESIQEAEEALELGWISGTGPCVAQFEQMLAERLKRRHCIAVTNGTHALELALQVLGVHAGDEVIVPALTFVSPAAASRQVGATPVFADVEEDTWCIDPHNLPVSRHTQALIGVDLLGHPADWTALRQMSSLEDIDLIEDAAQAHGAGILTNPCGSFGLVSTFSFHANKTITTGEGGALLTNGTRFIDKQARLIANHGMERSRLYWHEVVGSNYRMNNIQAAIGVGQMKNWDDLVNARRAVSASYDEMLADLFKAGDLQRRPVASWATEAPMLYAVTHPNRDKIVASLQAQDIDSRPLWTALPDLPLYRASLRGEYPVARRIAAQGFFLPTWADMPFTMIQRVAEAVKAAVSERITV